MRDSNPLVSIIVITYNSAKFVLETLESAKAQTYQNIELIISDDCSTDDTVEICREWIDVNKGRFVRTELIIVEMNTGIPANCNRGVKSAKGEWVKLIAGDDALMIDCIETYISEVLQFPEKLVLYSNVSHYKGKLEEQFIQSQYETGNLTISKSTTSAKEQFEILLRINKIWAGSLFMSKKIFEKLGYYDESLRLWEDRPMLLKITQNNIKLHFVDFISCKYRISSESVQASKSKKKLISPFQIEKESYFLQNYIKFLPLWERFVKTILIRRVLLLDRFNLNKNNIIIKGYIFITGFPFIYLVKKNNKKYL